MKLLTKELRRQIPKLYSQEHVADPIVQCKFFDPCGSWTWYVTEASGVNSDGGIVDIEGGEEVDVLFFGLVDGFVAELGYFRLSELQEARGKLGLPLERDMYWRPVPLSMVRAQTG